MPRPQGSQTGTVVHRLRKVGRKVVEDRWCAVWVYPRQNPRDPSERRKKKYFYAKTKTEARRSLNEWLRNQGLLTHPRHDEDMRIRQVCAWYLASREGKVRDSTFRRQVQLTRYIQTSWVLEPIPVSDIRGHDVDAFLQEIRTKGVVHKSKKHDGQEIYKPFSDQTIVHIYGALRAVLNFAVTQGYLTVNPCSRATRPKIRDQYRAKYLKPAEVRRFLRAAKSSKYEVLYLLGLTCGLRLGEASVVRWSDIDLDKGELHVSRTATLTDAGLREGAPKTPKGRRTIPLTPSVVDAIKSYREASKASPPEGLLFRNETGGIITTSTIRRDLANVCKSASLPQLRFHDLRHSFAHLNINANSLSANAVAYYMGHSDPHLLFLRYGASSELEQTTLRDTMEDLFHDEVRALPSRR